MSGFCSLLIQKRLIINQGWGSGSVYFSRIRFKRSDLISRVRVRIRPILNRIHSPAENNCVLSKVPGNLIFYLLQHAFFICHYCDKFAKLSPWCVYIYLKLSPWTATLHLRCYDETTQSRWVWPWCRPLRGGPACVSWPRPPLPAVAWGSTLPAQASPAGPTHGRRGDARRRSRRSWRRPNWALAP